MRVGGMESTDHEWGDVGLLDIATLSVRQLPVGRCGRLMTDGLGGDGRVRGVRIHPRSPHDQRRFGVLRVAVAVCACGNERMSVGGWG